MALVSIPQILDACAAPRDEQASLALARMVSRVHALEHDLTELEAMSGVAISALLADAHAGLLDPYSADSLVASLLTGLRLRSRHRSEVMDLPNVVPALSDALAADARLRADDRAWSSWVDNIRRLWSPDYAGTINRQLAGLAASFGVPLAVAAVALDAAESWGGADRFYPGAQSWHGPLLDGIHAQLLDAPEPVRRIAGTWAPTWTADPRELVLACADVLDSKMTCKAAKRRGQHPQRPGRRGY